MTDNSISDTVLETNQRRGYSGMNVRIQSPSIGVLYTAITPGVSGYTSLRYFCPLWKFGTFFLMKCNCMMYWVRQKLPSSGLSPSHALFRKSVTFNFRMFFSENGVWGVSTRGCWKRKENESIPSYCRSIEMAVWTPTVKSKRSCSDYCRFA